MKVVLKRQEWQLAAVKLLHTMILFIDSSKFYTGCSHFLRLQAESQMSVIQNHVPPCATPRNWLAWNHTQTQKLEEHWAHSLFSRTDLGPWPGPGPERPENLLEPKVQMKKQSWYKFCRWFSDHLVSRREGVWSREYAYFKLSKSLQLNGEELRIELLSHMMDEIRLY